MLSKLARSIVILTALTAAGLVTTTAMAEKIKDEGSFEATYVKREALPVPDQEGHVLLQTESSGMSSNPGGLIDGFATTVYEIADLRQGNGSHQGYVIYKKGSDQQVVKWEGTVTTTIKDGKPNTSMKGKYILVDGTGALAGIEGEGTYAGYFTAEDKYHIDWEGSRSQPKDSVAQSKE
jgi:hypothetical protein